LNKVAVEVQRTLLKSVQVYASELHDIPKTLVTGVQVGVGTAATVVIAGAAAVGAAAAIVVGVCAAAASAVANVGAGAYLVATDTDTETETETGFVNRLKTHSVAINNSIFLHITVVIETTSSSVIQKFRLFDKLTHGIVIQYTTTKVQLLENVAKGQ
jgi:hypothetical protein